MSKQHRKLSSQRRNDMRDEDMSRHYRIRRNDQDKKLMKNLERALRNKDYDKLVRSDDF